MPYLMPRLPTLPFPIKQGTNPSPNAYVANCGQNAADSDMVTINIEHRPIFNGTIADSLRTFFCNVGHVNRRSFLTTVLTVPKYMAIRHAVFRYKLCVSDLSSWLSAETLNVVDVVRRTRTAWRTTPHCRSIDYWRSCRFS